MKKFLALALVSSFALVAFASAVPAGETILIGDRKSVV